jgi:hypothetical protein
MGSLQNWSASAKDLLTLVFMPPTQASLLVCPQDFCLVAQQEKTTIPPQVLDHPASNQ